MPKTVSYDIQDQPDGRFTVLARMAPDRVYRRENLVTLAEAEAWIEGLRTLMAACGAPTVRADDATRREGARAFAPRERVQRDGD